MAHSIWGALMYLLMVMEVSGGKESSQDNDMFLLDESDTSEPKTVMV